MKPTKVIVARKQSAPAICERCGGLLYWFITPSPLSHLPYEELVLQRCLAGHVTRGDGVLPGVPVEENPWLDCGGTF